MKKDYTEADLPKIAQWVLGQASSKTLCFYGEMGAGKTTLIKELVRCLEGSDPGNSPTFGIVNEYEKTDGGLLGYHFDFYRLNDEMEAYDLGFEEYLAQNVWVFIEWPEKISSLIPEDATNITIEVADETARSIQLS